MRVGYIGIGNMGTPMSHCLLDAGHEVILYDLRPGPAAEDLKKKGAGWAPSPKALAQACEIVFTSLPGPSQVKDVVLNPDYGMLAGMKAGSIWADCTTNSPSVFRDVAAKCIAKGVEVLDAPVSGRPPNMTLMAAGSRETFERCRSVLKDMAKNLFYVGPLGHGMIAKLMTQYMGYTYRVAATEAFIIAAKAGVDLKILSQIVPVSAGSGHIEMVTKGILDFPTTGKVASTADYNVIAKDLNLACDFAKQVQAAAFTGLMAKETYERAEALGLNDFSGIIAVLEQMAGLDMSDPSSVRKS